jgi:hypothetical protein
LESILLLLLFSNVVALFFVELLADINHHLSAEKDGKKQPTIIKKKTRGNITI